MADEHGIQSRAPHMTPPLFPLLEAEAIDRLAVIDLHAGLMQSPITPT